VATPFADEPVAKKLQFGNDGSELPNLGFWFVLQRPGHDANNEKLLTHDDTRATLDDCFDHFVSFPDGRAANVKRRSCSTGSQAPLSGASTLTGSD
jgi:hypothetical protein